MKRIVFATNNKHKLQEIRSIVGSFMDVLSLEDIGCDEDIQEPATTIEGNALLKARFVKNLYGNNCFADDTGLEVDALNGLPGVHSARYAGDDCIAENNIRKLLKELEGKKNRKARFRTAIVLVLGEQEYLFEGVVEGRIIENKRGHGGFGYDPVFIPDGYHETFAEMDPDKKNAISHRGRATSKLVEFLRTVQ